jgi:hypothetical protein
MKQKTLVVLSLVALIATVIAWNTLGAEALPTIDEDTERLLAHTPPVRESPAPDDKPFVRLSTRLWPRPQVSGSSAGGVIHRLDGEQLGLPGISQLPEATNTPAIPAPVATNTPAAPVTDAGQAVSRLPTARSGVSGSGSSGSAPPVAEFHVTDAVHVQTAVQRAKDLRQAGVRLPVMDQGVQPRPHILPQGVSEETCVNVIWNSEMDVVEFGDGTGSIEFWTIVFPKVYYDPEVYNSPFYSLVMIDETDGSDTVVDPFWGTGNDYDMFGQAFHAPPNLTYLGVSYSRVYSDANAGDEVWSNLWTLDSEFYPDELVDYVTVGESPEGWSDRYWELDSAGLAQASGKTMAIVFDMLSDMTAPSEWVWLDDVQVTLCYERGPNAVYLPLIARQLGGAPRPTCSPREPDSVGQPGATTVDVTCGGSFSAVDEKDYYTLDLNGVRKVRLRLFNLPSGTNWDAMIYENRSGYPLACHIGTAGDADKAKNCNLNPNKNYFVLVSRGPETKGGSYRMRVAERQ